jgi:hypothetical protein
MNRKPYPSDGRDDEWALVTPYLILMRPDAPQRVHDLRASPCLKVHNRLQRKR